MRVIKDAVSGVGVSLVHTPVGPALDAVQAAVILHLVVVLEVPRPVGAGVGRIVVVVHSHANPVRRALHSRFTVADLNRLEGGKGSVLFHPVERPFDVLVQLA